MMKLEHTRRNRRRGSMVEIDRVWTARSAHVGMYSPSARTLERRIDFRAGTLELVVRQAVKLPRRGTIAGHRREGGGQQQIGAGVRSGTVGGGWTSAASPCLLSCDGCCAKKRGRGREPRLNRARHCRGVATSTRSRSHACYATFARLHLHCDSRSDKERPLALLRGHLGHLDQVVAAAEPDALRRQRRPELQRLGDAGVVSGRLYGVPEGPHARSAGEQGRFADLRASL